MRRLTAALTTLLALAAAPAAAVEEPFHGVLIQEVGPTEMMIDLGADQGLQVGQEVEVYQSVEVKHPVTGKRITDHVFLGTEVVQRLGRSVAVLGPLTSPAEYLKVGAPVRVPDLSAPTPIVPTECHCPTCALDPEAEAVHQQWMMNLGKPLDQRGKAWLEFLAAHPETPYRIAIEEEVMDISQTLNAFAKARQQAEAAAVVEVPAPRVGHRAPGETVAGEPLRLVVAVACARRGGRRGRPPADPPPWTRGTP